MEIHIGNLESSWNSIILQDSVNKQAFNLGVGWRFGLVGWLLGLSQCK